MPGGRGRGSGSGGGGGRVQAHQRIADDAARIIGAAHCEADDLESGRATA